MVVYILIFRLLDVRSLINEITIREPSKYPKGRWKLLSTRRLLARLVIGGCL